MDITTTATLHNGVGMPLLGLGTYQSEPGGELEQAVRWALEAGYRSIDTASFYFNEEGVGDGVATSAVPRDEVFITTKVWNSEQGYEETHAAFERSLGKLGVDYLDLYLIHWPRPLMMQETWRAMEEIHSSGAVRAIGVSNFMPHHLDQLAEHASIRPMVNQFEHHPLLQQPEVVDACVQREILVMAWAPLMRGRAGDIRPLAKIAEQHGVTPSQVSLRWLLQRGIAAIPKSVTQSRIIENADIYNFELSPADMAAINALDENDRTGPHPDIFPGT